MLETLEQDQRKVLVPIDVSSSLSASTQVPDALSS